jgi:hypothetical protein
MRQPAKTPTVAIARILRDMGLKQGLHGDFAVRGYSERGERLGTMVVLYTRAANILIDERADEIERLSEESGWVFRVSTRYHHVSGAAYPDLCNFGKRVRRTRPVTGDTEEIEENVMSNTATHRATLTGGSEFSGPRRLTIAELDANGNEGYGRLTVPMDGDKAVNTAIADLGMVRVGEWASPAGSWSDGVMAVDLRRA